MECPPERLPEKSSATPVDTDPVRAAALFEQSAAIMARLRAPGGCPWDQEQSFETIRKYTLEEVYEVFDAIERRDFPHLAEELGDLLLQVLFCTRQLGQRRIGGNRAHARFPQRLLHRAGPD